MANTKQNELLEQKLLCKINLIEAEIALKAIQLAEVRQELNDCVWIKATWKELADWLKKNRPENDHNKNQKVKNKYGQESYCKLSIDNELCIGGYVHNDNFPEGCDLFVRYDFKSWNS